MKKRLLITSIVMMLVVAVALSTATYAWFTANTTVSASTLTLRATVSDSDALGIGWLGAQASSSISAGVDETIKPMAPETLTVGSTTSDLIFRSSTIREENDLKVFNGSSASYVVTSDSKAVQDKTYYSVVNGVYVAQETTVGETTVTGMYEKSFAPVVYNNLSGVQAFYVKNLSDTNTVSKVTVTAKFATEDTYVLTNDTNFKLGVTYYTEDNGTYTAITVIASGEPGANQVLAGAAVTASTYYEKLTADDMIRIAIFTKAPSTGSAAAGNYTLLGVLGKTATVGTAVGSASYDQNTTYYTRTGDGSTTPYVYTQDDTVTSANFDDKKATLYTCANTAVYGASSVFEDNDAVKSIGHYTNVVNSMTLIDNLAPLKEVDIVAIAWLDGTELDDSRAHEIGQFYLEFKAEA